MPGTQHAIDALIRAFDSLTGLLYTAAFGDEAAGGPNRDAAAHLTGYVRREAFGLPRRAHVGDDGLRSPYALRCGFEVIGSAADLLRDELIDSSTAAPLLFEVIEQLGNVVDLEWLAEAASADGRRLLPATVELIAALVVARPADDPLQGGPEITDAEIVTVLMADDVDDPAAALERLRAGGAAYSVLHVDDSGAASETLWLPGMRVPLRRRVVQRHLRTLYPVFSWAEHVALVAASDECTAYAQLVAAYLSSRLEDAVADPDIETLSRVAEAMAAR